MSYPQPTTANWFTWLLRLCLGSKTLTWLIVVNVMVFFLVWAVIFGGRMFGLEGNFTMKWLCVSSDPAVAATHPWTLLTYMVTQYDFLHLLFNVLWLYWFGIFLPEWVSDRRRLYLYVGCGLAGAALYIAVCAIWPSLSTAGSWLCGSSASVLGIMTAAAMWTPKRRVTLFLFGTVQFRWLALACIVLAFFGYGGGSPAAQSAHLGGVVCGAIFALVSKGSLSSENTGRKSHRPHPGLFKPSRKIRLNITRDGRAVAETMSERLSDTGRLDALLDKIRLSGYSSLTTGERNELNVLSQRLNKGKETTNR